MSSLAGYPLRRPDADLKQVRGNLILIRGEDLFRLNASGVEIWQRCDGRTGLIELVDRLEEVFIDVDRATLVQDCEEFLTEMTEHDLLTWQASINETSDQ